MKPFIKLVLAVMALLLLGGCASRFTTKHNPQAEVGTVILTPTGNMRTANKNFADAYEARAYQLLTESIKGNLPVKYRKNIVVNNRAEQSVSFSDWFSADQVNLNGMQGLGQDTLLVDYGFIQLGLTNYVDTGALRAEGSIGVIFIDSKNGKVVGRATANAMGNWVLGNADAFDTNGEFVASLRRNQSASEVPAAQIDAAFQRLINRLVAEAIGKITSSQ